MLQLRGLKDCNPIDLDYFLASIALQSFIHEDEKKKVNVFWN